MTFLILSSGSGLLKNRGRARWSGAEFGTHRSAHSTNAGGISLRTIITRKTRSS
jgi:hypothetical protein